MMLSCLLVFAALPIAASSEESTDNKVSENQSTPGNYSTKDEVIYGKLDANGKIKNMYVVNSFHMTKPGEIIDYGNYNDLRNLTDLTSIEQAENKLLFQAVDDFYYQGELENKALPWDISIKYLLDGKEMNPDVLPGQTGNLEIQISTSANKNVDPLFFNYYLLQISLKFDPMIFEDIQAPEGTEANEGKDKLISFNVMPEQEETFIISADVTNLEMDPINISAVPANLGFDSPDTEDIASEMQELSDAIHDVNTGVSELKDGISTLNSGASDLSKGSTSYQTGMSELNQSSGELINGSKEILNVFQQFSNALDDTPEIPDLDDLNDLPKGLRDISKELKEFSKTVDVLQEAIQDIPDNTINEEQIKALYEALEESDADDQTVEVVNQLVATYEAAQIVKNLNEQIPDQLATLIKNLANNLDLIADGLEEAMLNIDEFDGLDDLAQLQDGLNTMSSEYEKFHKGLISYTDGVNTLTKSYQEINNGTKELSNGIADLESGVSELHDGTTELEESTSDLSGELQSEIDKFMEEFDFSDFEPLSFVSNKNKKVGVVQFVLQTERIEIEEPEPIVEEEEEVEKSLWDRFVDLFK